MRAEFILPGDDRWERFLQGVPHDSYHLPAYLAFCAGQEGGEAVAFLAEDGGATMLAPLLLRGLPPSLCPDGRYQDASAPYGYACPLLAGDPDPGQVAAFLGTFRDQAKARGIVSAFFRLHPLLPLPREPFLEYGQLVDHGETIFLDLTQSVEELDAQVRAGHRSDLRHLQREGYTVVMDDWGRLDDFVRVYEQTMVRHAASAFYFFGRNYFDALRAALGERLHLAVVLAPGGGTVASAGLFLEEAGALEYHLSGTDEWYLKDGPTKLMLNHVRDWGKARGDRWFHLGGGVGAQADSLFDFKKGFSRLRATFTSFRMIVDPEAYGELSTWGHGPSDRKLLERRRYFPGYRRPSEREAS
jgi:hypothetical protein